MPTEAQKRAIAAHEQKRRARGDRKVSVWLSAEALRVLEAKKAAGLSQEATVNAAIVASGRVTKVPVVKDVLSEEPVKAKPEPGYQVQIGPRTFEPGAFAKKPKGSK